MKKAICLLAAILAFSGCSLGEVKDKGASCPPKSAEEGAKLGIIGGVECSETDCVVDGTDYTENIQFGYCPMEFSQCGYDSAKDVYYCAKIACGENEHIYEDECESDSIRHCGSHENDCKQLSGWKSGECSNKQCVAENCVTGYEVYKGKCKAKSTECEEGEHYYTDDGECEKNTIENCGSHGNACTELSGWKEGACSTEGICLAIECSSGYELKSGKCVALTECSDGQHLYNGACEDDSVENCGRHGGDCTRTAGWLGGDCSDGECVASACDKGYELKNGKCEARLTCPDHQHIYSGECEDDVVENCGRHGNDCSKVAGWSDGYCESGECMSSACASGYELNAGKCVALTTCLENEHFNSGECESDSLENCGNHGYSCTNVPGWDGGNCTAGKCVPEACSAGYELKDGKCEALTECPAGEHLHAGACEADSVEHCGQHENDCSKSKGWGSGKCVGSVCVSDKCAEGYCLSVDGQCVDGEGNRNACGVSGDSCEACSSEQTCAEGICQANICDADKHIYNGTCESDSLANCGGHEKPCKIEHAVDQVCVSGGCKPIKCEDGFHPYGVVCEPDSVNHCGDHGKKCELANASAHVCEAKTCKATSCSGAFHVYEGACEADSVNHCGGHGMQCELANASEYVCESKTCKATSCSGAFHVYEGACEADDTNHCGKHETACTGIANATGYICENKTCKPKTCGGDYHPYNNICEPDTTTDCGGHGNKCSGIANASEYVCESKTCKPKTCSGDYHPYNNICEPDSIYDCGKHGSICQDIEYASEYVCESKTCKPSACDEGNHVWETICEPDDTENCGYHGNKCENIANADGYKCEEKTCKPQKCKGDYHVWEAVCEQNDVKNCGSHAYLCSKLKVSNSTEVTCTNTNGICKATSCYEGYELENGACISICPAKTFYCSDGVCCQRPGCAGSCILAR